ncbi:MAG: ATP-binding cassette domain-containing protein [Bacteroidota bacterium]|nr:ATP-binding cassette domain-containing protein [Bacteroidota bacterium]
MISIKGLVVGYGDKKVLNGIDWSLETGRIHGLAGLNGSGKTTLMKALFGIIKPESGSMEINSAPFKKRMLSFLETEPYFYHGITGEEYLSLFISGGIVKFIAEEWATMFHLPLNELIDNYSTGMKKKLALLGVIKTNKPLLLLDEPYNGLDLESSRILTAVLKKLKQAGKTIIITSHVLESLTNLCDQIHYLKNGVIDKTYLPHDLMLMNDEIFKELDQNIENKIDDLLKP